MPCSSDGDHDLQVEHARKFWARKEERDRAREAEKAEKPKKSKKPPEGRQAGVSREETLAELRALVSASGLQSLLSSGPDLDALTRLTCEWIRKHNGVAPEPLKAWWTRHKLWDERRQKAALDAFVNGASIGDIDVDDLREAVKALVKSVKGQGL